MRKGSKITLMGQNGAGKSTLFGLIGKKFKPKEGKISIEKSATIGTANQTVARDDLVLNVEKYFTKAFDIIPGNIKSQVRKVMEAVNLVVPTDRPVGELSGGQQARLLLAFALIQKPDILLLDEPTNNLDQTGIDIQEMRAVAAGFLITGELMGHKIADLSEGQKGLLSFARLVLMQPGLLIFDEPTNHINFRHIPIIADAINDYEGVVILVSHMNEFVDQIKIDEYLDLVKV